MTRGGQVATGVVLAIVLAGAAWWWWGRPAQAPAAPVAVAPSPAPESAAVPSAPAATPEAVAPEPRAVTAPLDRSGIGAAFGELLGADSAKTWLRVDDFPRRLVATVDNLARAHAPSHLWPVDPTAGRFAVADHAGRSLIDPDNAQRYAPFVRLLEGVDAAAAVALYVRLLPLLQQAYEDLGFPQRRFHTRLLGVIDHLLAAPEAPERIEVVLTEVRGPIPSVRPWVRYEFADPALESASAGHKLMVRVGAAHQRRLKAKLRELRAELVRRANG